MNRRQFLTGAAACAAYAALPTGDAAARLIVNQLTGFGVKKDRDCSPSDVWESGSTSTGNGFESVTWVNRNFTIPDGSYVTRLGVNMANSITDIEIYLVERTGAGTYVVRASVTGSSHGGTGQELFTLSSPYTISSSNPFYIAHYQDTQTTMVIPASGSFNRALKAGKWSGTVTGVTEGSSKEVPMPGATYC